MGFAGWDVPAIAQKLGVAKNTLYSYIGRYRGVADDYRGDKGKAKKISFHCGRN